MMRCVARGMKLFRFFFLFCLSIYLMNSNYMYILWFLRLYLYFLLWLFYSPFAINTQTKITSVKSASLSRFELFQHWQWGWCSFVIVFLRYAQPLCTNTHTQWFSYTIALLTRFNSTRPFVYLFHPKKKIQLDSSVVLLFSRSLVRFHPTLNVNLVCGTRNNISNAFN